MLSCGIPFIILENKPCQPRAAHSLLVVPTGAINRAGFFIELFMSKDPAVLFYTADFRQGTMLLSDEQVGQYIRLLCDQHQNGHLPDQHIINVCRTYDNPVLKKFIKDEDGCWYNKRMQEEIEKRASYCESRRKARFIGIEKQKNKQHTSQHTSQRMDNENDNEDVVINKIEDRGIKFLEEINTFKQYETSMLNEFYSYWSEPNKSKTKMRYELQPTWDLGRRLKTWADRQKIKPQQRYGRQEVSMETLKKQFSEPLE